MAQELGDPAQADLARGFPEPERKRHLLRLWLAAAEFDDGDARLRRGMAPETAEAAP